jgi:hypothetical protein
MTVSDHKLRQIKISIPVFMRRKYMNSSSEFIRMTIWGRMPCEQPFGQGKNVAEGQQRQYPLLFSSKAHLAT